MRKTEKKRKPRNTKPIPPTQLNNKTSKKSNQHHLLRTILRLSIALLSPYLLSLYLPSTNLGQSSLHRLAEWYDTVSDYVTGGDYDRTTNQEGGTNTDTTTLEQEEENSGVTLDTQERMEKLWEGVTVVLHRNGEPEPCVRNPFVGVDLKDGFHQVLTERGFRKKPRSRYNPFRNGPTKYQFDSALTTALHNLQPTVTPRTTTDTDTDMDATCGPERPSPTLIGVKKRKKWGRKPNYEIYKNAHPFLSYCDMGEDHTVILPDHDDLLKVVVQMDTIDENGAVTSEQQWESLPCHFYTREGVRISSFKGLEKAVEDAKRYSSMEEEEEETVGTDDTTTSGEHNKDKDCTVDSDGKITCTTETTTTTTTTALHLYAVPAGRVFMFAPSYIGEIFHLRHMKKIHDRDIRLEVLSLVPRVFDVINFFDEGESKEIVDRALKETSDSHRMKRSSTGATGYNVNSQRTSENGFDTNGKVAMEVKRRCMTTLGFDEYIESFTDGLQVLRYNQTTAYIPHLDWIDDPGLREEHDYISSKKGTNRFATFLLYMSDMNEGDGGETVFAEGWPTDVPVSERVSRKVALTRLRESGEATFLEKGSWEEKMVADCRSRLAVKPKKARAVLFYSQHPNGEEDNASLHGGCPVLSSVNPKWAANLWVWNGPRVDYAGAPVNPKFARKNKNKEQVITQADGSQRVTFENTGRDPAYAEADIYYTDTFWAEFSHGSPLVSVNTYDGHEWNVRRKSDGKTLITWVIGKGERKYHYEV